MDGPGTMFMGCCCPLWLILVSMFSIAAIYPISFGIIKLITRNVNSSLDQLSLPSLIVTIILFFVLLFLPWLSLYINSR